MSDVKTVHDLGKTFSGDGGYCHYTRNGRGVQVEWFGATVVAVHCEHDICGYKDRCEMYKRHPVGYVEAFPNAPAKEDS